MSSTMFDEDAIQRLRERHPNYHETAYLFVLSALHHVIEKLPEPRHITGRELAVGVRDLALERFGPMARSVLEHWGVHSTTDVGELVFAMIDCGILVKQEEDRIEDFRAVFDFEQAFEQDYPWGSGL